MRTPKTAIAEPEVGETAKVVDAVSDKVEVRVVTIALDEAADRDPFAISPIHFPKPHDPNANHPDGEKSDADGDEDLQGVKAVNWAHVRAAINGLSLDAAMPTAGLVNINGKTHRRGDQVSVDSNGQRWTFTIAEVSDRSVLLVYGERRFELEMSGPGG